MTLLLLAAPVVLFLQRYEIMDWWRLRDYDPPARIAELADNTAMTEYGKRLFFVHDPVLSERDTFSASCPGFEETIILGCYIPHRAIYIFNVEDERLDGIEEVTAAHEMLHAVYDRLPSREKTRVEDLLDKALSEVKSERVLKTVASYEKRDPLIVTNELHSILGTEVENLPNELEEYYSQYFFDRGRVVAYAQQYEDVFVAQQQRLDELQHKITQNTEQLAGLRQEIEMTESRLRDESERLDQLRSNNQTTQYNAAVSGYNAQVNAYKDIVNSYNSQVETVNKLIEEYNKAAVQQKQLFDAIDSRPQTL